MNIRPVSDLRNKFADVEKEVNDSGAVFLTKNGQRAMVVMSFEQYKTFNNTIENALDIADFQSEMISHRYSHDEIFNSARLNKSNRSKI